MRRPQLVLIVVLAIALSACAKQDPEVSANDQVPANMRVAEDTSSDSEGGGGGGEGEPVEADALWAAGQELAYTQEPATMPADGAVIALELTAGTPHNVIFEGFEGDRILVEGSGQGVTSEEVAVPAGSYTFYCNIAGHRAAGMEGEITVGS